MQRQIFATDITRVLVAESRGTLTVETWDERGVAVEALEPGDRIVEEDGALVLRGISGELRLRVPAEAFVTVDEHRGDVSIAAIDGTVRLREIYGRATVARAASLVVEQDRERRHIDRDFERVRRDIEARQIGVAELAAVYGSLAIDTAERVAAGGVGGDALVRHVTGDLTIRAVGGSCEIRAVGGDLALCDVGGNCTVDSVGGAVRVRSVGGDATLRATGAVAELGSVGGDLTLQKAILDPSSSISVTVGGNARIELPAEPDLTVSAIAGGTIDGRGGFSGRGMRTIVYGDGSGRLSVTAGGDLTLA